MCPSFPATFSAERRAFRQETVEKMRDAIADLMTDRDWIVLRAEFEVGALEPNASGNALLKCTDSSFATEVSL
jgi:hypothetical protein